MPFPVGDNITCDSPEGFSPDGGSRAEHYEEIKLCEMNRNKITCDWTLFSLIKLLKSAETVLLMSMQHLTDELQSHWLTGRLKAS